MFFFLDDELASESAVLFPNHCLRVLINCGKAWPVSFRNRRCVRGWRSRGQKAARKNYRSVGYPFVDIFNGGTLDGLLAGLAVTIDLAGPNTKIIPGHGPIVDRKAVIAQRDFVLAMRDRMLPLISKGMTFDQVLAANLTAHSGIPVPDGAYPAEHQFCDSNPIHRAAGRQSAAFATASAITTAMPSRFRSFKVSSASPRLSIEDTCPCQNSSARQLRRILGGSWRRTGSE
jgi:hypothetical protein